MPLDPEWMAASSRGTPDWHVEQKRLVAAVFTPTDREDPADTPFGWPTTQCPVPGCGCDYVHPERVTINAGGSITSVDRGGTRMSAGPADGRGVAIEIGFACEWGHRFTARFHFHKGITESEIVDFREYDPEDETAGPRTIWRD